MKLYFREFGSGDPLVILHGLYGSSDNWVSIAKTLEKSFRVILVDQRNHGQSPHSPEHTYTSLTSDLLEFFDDLKLEKAILLGHSMGGKVAMQFTIDHPERVTSLIVVDIAPWSHISSISDKIIEEHQLIIKGLKSIPINSLTSRNQADDILSNWVRSEQIRQFLLKNLKREQNGSFSWKLNLSTIASNLNNLMDRINPKTQNQPCKVKTLFIKGELSNYIPVEREKDLKEFFGNSRLVTIEQAGHWVHSEKPNEFSNTVFEFLNH